MFNKHLTLYVLERLVDVSALTNPTLETLKTVHGYSQNYIAGTALRTQLCPSSSGGGGGLPGAAHFSAPVSQTPHAQSWSHSIFI